MDLKTELANKNALLFNSAIESQIKEICQPLFDNFEITHFGYMKFLKSGYYIGLSNDLKWLETYYTHDLASASVHFSNQVNSVGYNNLVTSLWPSQPNEDVTLTALMRHNIWNGINFDIKHENYLEVFYFASSPENESIKNFYLRYYHLLKRFIAYFKERAAHLIDTNDISALGFSNQYKLLLSENKSVLTENEQLAKKVNAFLDQTLCQSYKLGENNKVSLTPREAQCFYMISEGKTFKEIAKKLDISNRTVETYLNNIKLKTGFNNKSDLVDQFKQDMKSWGF